MTDAGWDNLCGHFDAFGDPNHNCSAWDHDDEWPCPGQECVRNHLGNGIIHTDECYMAIMDDQIAQAHEETDVDCFVDIETGTIINGPVFQVGWTPDMDSMSDSEIIEYTLKHGWKVKFD